MKSFSTKGALNLSGIADPVVDALVGKAIAAGKIAAVAPDIPASEAHQSVSAKGRLVMPGLVDMHAHVLLNGHDMGMNTDRCCRGR